MTRRTGKVGEKTGSTASAETAGSNLQDRLEPTKQALGTAIADNITAGSLMIAFQKLERGEYGPMTEQLLQSVGKLVSPLEESNQAILAWHQPLALPSANESPI